MAWAYMPVGGEGRGKRWSKYSIPPGLFYVPHCKLLPEYLVFKLVHAFTSSTQRPISAPCLLLYVHCLYCSPPHNLRQKFLSNQVTQSLFKLCHVCRVTTPFKSLLPEYHRKFESPHIFRPRSPNQIHEVFSGTRN